MDTMLHRRDKRDTNAASARRPRAPKRAGGTQHQLFPTSESDATQSMWLDGGHEFGGNDDMNSPSDLTEHMQRLLREEKQMQRTEGGRRPNARSSNRETPLVHDVFEHRADGIAENHATILQRQTSDRSLECTFRPHINTFTFSRTRRSFLAEVELHAQMRKRRQEEQDAETEKQMKLMFRPHINAYSASLEFEQPVHERLHECYGTHIRHRLEKQAKQLFRSNSSFEEKRSCFRIDRTQAGSGSDEVPTRTPDQVSKDLHLDSYERQERRRALQAHIDETVFGSGFRLSSTSELYFRRHIERDLDAALKKLPPRTDRDALLYEEAEHVLRSMGFLTAVAATGAAAAPNHQTVQLCMQRLDQHQQGVVQRKILREFVMQIAGSDAANDDVLLEQLRSARRSCKHSQLAAAAAAGLGTKAESPTVASTASPSSTIEKRAATISPRPSFSRLKTGELWPRRAEVKARIEAIRKQRLEAELAECSFRPSIGKPPKHLRKRESSAPPGQRLYAEATRRQHRLERKRREQHAMRERQLLELLDTSASRPAPAPTPAPQCRTHPKGFDAFVGRLRNAAHTMESIKQRDADAKCQVPKEKLDQQRRAKAYFEKHNRFWKTRELKARQDDEFFADDDSHTKDPTHRSEVFGAFNVQGTRNTVGRTPAEAKAEAEAEAACLSSDGDNGVLTSVTVKEDDLLCEAEAVASAVERQIEEWADAHPKLMPESEARNGSSTSTADRAATNLRWAFRATPSSTSKTYDVKANDKKHEFISAADTSFKSQVAGSDGVAAQSLDRDPIDRERQKLYAEATLFSDIEIEASDSDQESSFLSSSVDDSVDDDSREALSDEFVRPVAAKETIVREHHHHHSAVRDDILESRQTMREEVLPKRELEHNDKHQADAINNPTMDLLEHIIKNSEQLDKAGTASSA